MKLRSLRFSLASAGVLSAFTLSGFADVVIMKDGKKYENANILSETADSVTFKYPLTPRIPDTRTEMKANVAQIIKQRPEELEVVPLRKLAVSDDLLTADKYEGIIQDQLRPFVAKYPGSPEAKEVEGIIATLQGEKEKVVSGQLKMDGEWLQPEVVKRDTHSIDGYRLRREMKDNAAKNEWRDALNVWDKMIDRNDGYTDTEHYVKAIPEVTKILESYKKELEKMLTEQPFLQKRRDDSMKSMVEPDLGRAKAAIAAEQARVKTANDGEKAAKSRWLTVYKYDAKGIQAAEKVVVGELAKIAALDVNRLSTTIQAVTAARRYIATGNLEEADTALTQAVTASGRDPTLSTTISKLKTEIGKLRMEQNRKRTIQKSFGNAGAVSGSASAAPATDDLVAKALAKTEKDKADKKEAKEAAPGGLSSLNTSSSKAKATDGGKAAVGATGGGDDGSATKAKRKSSSSSDAVEAKEESGLSKYMLPGGIGLLVILLASMFLQKKPK